jgi:hypothetical protein
MTPTRTWTEHASRCRFCGILFRISKEAINETREAERGVYPDDELTDEVIANSLDICLTCVTGEQHDGEHVFSYDDACDERSYGDPYEG